MKTYMAKPQDIEKNWYLIDADNIPLGRLASEIAQILRGKHKPTFTPHIDVGDFVVVINAKKVKLTGKKAETKLHYKHSGYIGSLKAVDYGTLLEKKPTFVVKEAVKGMLPKGRLGRSLLKKLKVYADENHPHEAQKPEKYELKYTKEKQNG